MAVNLRLNFSPCPNDTFIFGAIAKRLIDTEGLAFEIRMEDIETLNRRAFRENPDVIKVSYHAYLYLREKYELLRSGSALGFGNGPLLVAREPIPPGEIHASHVALPGEFTTAHLLFRYAFPSAGNKTFMVFSEIEQAVLEGRADAGVIIHESRFTYEKKGLVRILDLGEFWEKKTGAPVPLGGIIARKDLGAEMIAKVNRILRRSVEYALRNPEKVMDFVRKNAQEMEEEVMMKHIRLYVNEFTIDLEETGQKAIEALKTILLNKESAE